MKGPKEYEIVFEYYDYLFLKKTIRKTDYFTATSATAAKLYCYWKHGDLIDIISCELSTF